MLAQLDIKCTLNLKILSPNTDPSSITIVKSAVINGTNAGDTITYSFLITNTGLQDLTDVKITDNKLGISNLSIPNLAAGAMHNETPITYTILASDVAAGNITNTVIVSALDENLNTVTDSDTLVTNLVLPNLFFTIDGVSPIAWTGIDYVDQCIRVDSDDALVRGIAEATTYINANYPGQILNAADGTWDGPASGPIMVHDATLLMTMETTVINTNVRIPIVNDIDTVFIDWGDGSPLEVSPALIANPSHIYAVAGQYQVNVCGNLQSISWSGATNAQRQFLISIDQWGDTLATSSQFSQSDNIISIDPNLSSSITDLSQFFLGADSNPDFTNFDTSNVTDMSQMFFLNNTSNPNTALWNTSNVTDMSNMFALASAANPDVTNWDVSNVTTFNSMFENADLATPNTSLWDTSSAIIMTEMFQNTALANPDVTNWDVSNVTTFINMFASALSATPDVSLWDISSATNIQGVFFFAPVATPDVTNWDVSNVTNFSNLFYNAVSASPDVSLWNTSNATTMASMFRGVTSNPDVVNFDVSGVTNFSDMFNNADSANPVIGGWNMSAATNISGMFSSTAIANPDVSLWDVSNVTNMSNVFLNALTASPDVSSWDTSSATSMSGMFHGNTSNPDVSAWNTANVTNMSNMFNSNTVANPDVSLWNTSSVTNMSSMFSGNTSANPNVSNFDVSGVTTFNAMFNGASVADPDVSSWDIQSINLTFSSMANIFNNSGISVPSYDAALIQFDIVATANSKTGYNMGTVPQNFTIATSGAARANLVGPLSWSIIDNGGI